MTTNRELVERYDKSSHEIEYNVDLDTLDVYKKLKRVKVYIYTKDINTSYCAVQFKIENWTGGKFSVHYRERDFGWGFVKVDSSFVRTASAPYVALSTTECPLYIGQDAQDKWSAPVIFNREQREKLQDLKEYLEEKLNAS